MTNTLNDIQVVAVNANNLRSTMLDDIGKITGDETVVDRYEHSPYLRYRVKRFKLGMCIGSNIGNAIALTDAQLLERGRPAITAFAKLRIRQTQVSIDNSFTIRIQPPGAAQKIERG